MRPIVLSAPSFRSSNSFAKMARYHALYLHNYGFDVYLDERGEPRPAEVLDLFHRTMVKTLLNKKSPPGAPRLYYDIPDGMKDRLNAINFATFESANLLPRWVSYANNCLHTCVISHHNKHLLIQEGVDSQKVSVVNLGYDPNLYCPNKIPMWPKDGKFVFLYVNHFNPRKGVETLLHAFCDEFSSYDPVKLVMVTQSMYDQVDVKQAIATIVAFHDNPPEIELHLSPFNGGISEDMMASVYASGDCLVNPTKGEAFGLPNLEALACGLEVITTRCSGQLDYLNDNNCHFIEVDNITIDPACAAVNKSYSKLMFWIPSHESLRLQMRQVFNGLKKADVPSGWTWDETTFQLPLALKKVGIENG